MKMNEDTKKNPSNIIQRLQEQQKDKFIYYPESGLRTAQDRRIKEFFKEDKKDATDGKR
jgi:hypothetical protein